MFPGFQPQLQAPHPRGPTSQVGGTRPFTIPYSPAQPSPISQQDSHLKRWGIFQRENYGSPFRKKGLGGQYKGNQPICPPFSPAGNQKGGNLGKFGPEGQLCINKMGLQDVTLSGLRVNPEKAQTNLNQVVCATNALVLNSGCLQLLPHVLQVFGTGALSLP